MSRAHISAEVQAAVLLRARRRCCICFGLKLDTSIKQGQIAHLDGDSSNSAEDNLAFLCLDHHDQFDSTTSQSKNFTRVEVKAFRTELHVAIRMAFDGQVTFGEARAAVHLATGHYIRDGESDSAELKVHRLPDGRYHVSGFALHGKDREHGPNIGDLDFITELNGGVMKYAEARPERQEYCVELAFEGAGLKVTEENWFGRFGVGVNFSGTYKKAT